MSISEEPLGDSTGGNKADEFYDDDVESISKIDYQLYPWLREPALEIPSAEKISVKPVNGSSLYIAQLAYQIHSLQTSAAKKENLAPYNKSLFTPWSGPFFHPVWDLPPPYQLYTTVGFPLNPYNLSSQLNPTYQEGEKYYYHDLASNEVVFKKFAQNFTLFELTNELLRVALSEDETMRIQSFNGSVAYSLAALDQLLMHEALRPRIYLNTLIDDYRMLTRSTELCLIKQSAATGNETEPSCKKYYEDFPQFLWMYNWVLCYHMRGFLQYDRDRICPRVCRPHSKIDRQRTLPGLPPLNYRQNAVEDVIDVCAQLVYAVQGTCRVGTLGTATKHFRCQCTSSAYKWSIRNGTLGCTLSDRIMAVAENVLSPTWNMPCLLREQAFFCSENGTTTCYYRLKRESNSNSTELLPTDYVRKGIWPICECHSMFAGAACERQYDACIDPIPNALVTPASVDASYLGESLQRPIGFRQDPKAATGNTMCGVHLEYGKCISDVDRPRCLCNPGYERHNSYSKFPNCQRPRVHEATTEESEGGNIKCGKIDCMNALRCETKLEALPLEYTPENTPTSSDIEVVYKMNNMYLVKKVCVCAPGYAGEICDLQHGVWSVWSSWSACTPICGKKRYRYRLRDCHGDIGCPGSAQEIIDCSPTICPSLPSVGVKDVFGHKEKSIPKPQVYREADIPTILTWLLGIILPLEVFLIGCGTFLLHRYIETT